MHINPKLYTKCPPGYCTKVFQILYITYYKFNRNHNDLKTRFQEVSILLLKIYTSNIWFSKAHFSMTTFCIFDYPFTSAFFKWVTKSGKFPLRKSLVEIFEIKGLAMLLASIFYHWKKPWLKYFKLRVGFVFSTTIKHLMNKDALGDFVMFKLIMKNLLYSNIN
jgi:hypothetical protein